MPAHFPEHSPLCSFDMEQNNTKSSIDDPDRANVPHWPTPHPRQTSDVETCTCTVTLSRLLLSLV